MIYPGSIIFIGDVAVTYGKMQPTFAKKMKQYETMSQMMNAVTMPWIMHSSGAIFPQTLEILNSLTHAILFDASAYKRDLIINTQFAVMKGQVDGLNRLRYRGAIEGRSVEQQ